jgi:predicted protein tyrosine phosphatase
MPGPPPSLLVFGLGEVLCARAFRPDAVLSLLSPGQEAPRFEGEQLVLRLADADDDGPGAPTLAQARLAAAFLETHRGTPRIRIHCLGGVSRSPAAALALLHRRGLPPKALAPTLLRLRPQARPNRRLAHLPDQALGLPGVLTAAAAALHHPIASD